MSLAVGRITAAGAAKEAFSGVLLDLYQHAPDGATHSASGWTLRQWKVGLPQIAVDPPGARVGQASRLMVQAVSLTYGGGREWFVNSQGQTMIKIPAGSFTRKGKVTKEQTVTLTRPFYLSDREVSVDQFQQFVHDPDYPEAEKAQKWLGVPKSTSPTDNWR